MKGEAGGRKFSFREDINVKVWPVTMRTPDFPNVNWAFDFDGCMKQWNGGVQVEKYSAEHEEYLRQLYGMLAEGHQTMTRIPVWDVVGMQKKSDGSWEFDFTRFDWYVKICEEAGILHSLQVEELGHRLVPLWTSPMGLFVPVEIDGKMISFKAPFRRLTMTDAIREKTGYDITGQSEEQLREACKRLNVEIDDTMGKGKLIDAIFGTYCEQVDERVGSRC